MLCLWASTIGGMKQHLQSLPGQQIQVGNCSWQAQHHCMWTSSTQEKKKKKRREKTPVGTHWRAPWAGLTLLLLESVGKTSIGQKGRLGQQTQLCLHLKEDSFQSSHTNHTIAAHTIKVTAAKPHPDPFRTRLPLNPDAPGSPIGPVGPTSPLMPRKPRTPGKPGLPVSPWSEAGPGGPRDPGGPGRPRDNRGN